MPNRVLLVTLGSVGDVFPFLAIAVSLLTRGTRVAIGSNPKYRQLVEERDVDFVPIGDALDPTCFQRSNLGQGGDNDVNGFMEHAIFRQLTRLFTDIDRAAQHADAIVAPYFMVPAQLAAERRRIPFIPCALTPAHFIKGASALRGSTGQRTHNTPAHWHTAIAELRRMQGLPRTLLSFVRMCGPETNMLGLFPSFLMPNSVLRMPPIRVLGYPHLAQHRSAEADLEGAIDRRTVIFTFGTHVERRNSHHLFRESIDACRQLGLRCVYLSRHITGIDVQMRDGDDVSLRGFLPHDAVFPPAGIIVHHGGLGTLIAACRHAKAMVLVPFSHDQPYNAQRIAELCGCPAIAADAYDRDTLTIALQEAERTRDAVEKRLQNLMALQSDGAQHVSAAIDDIANHCNR